MNSFRYLILAVLCLVLPVALVFAAKGPCYYTKYPKTTDNTVCDGGQCGGVVWFNPGCMGCQGTNEDDCSSGDDGELKMYAVIFAQCTNKSTCGIDTSSSGSMSTGCPKNCD